MATKFDFETVYDSSVYVNSFTSSSGLAERFLEVCKEGIVKSEFPNVDCDVEEFVSGGFFSKEKTRMLALSFKKSQFDKLGIFFRAQSFGNLVVFQKYEVIDKGFIDILSGKGNSDVLASIRRKCKNMAQWEEYVALRNLGDIVYWDALRKIDPEYEAKQKLSQLKPGDGK